MTKRPESNFCWGCDGGQGCVCTVSGSDNNKLKTTKGQTKKESTDITDALRRQQKIKPLINGKN